MNDTSGTQEIARHMHGRWCLMKDLKVLSSSIYPGVRHESIHNVDSINTALLGIYTKNVIIDGYHPKCVYTLCPPDVTAYV